MALLRLLRLAVVCVLAVPAAKAHHGSEFLGLEDYGIGHPGEGLINSGFDIES